MHNIDPHGILPAEPDQKTAAKYWALLPKIAIAILAVGAIAAGIIWIASSGSTGQDISILTLIISFALSITVMSIRELIGKGN
ncbi:hypothetical protein [Trueperella bialowiezensis]|uniref:Uncharacterized protein n=1 Tax=Trueperella bialowiezensis TaxID=312285 RepID=A0A448PGV4_9ACTO|nr:hypothetical protein [Trueperella bialowiezensis]VEI14136.1 Uncharacterised protein [Trueperella bialowiezensis]